MHQVHVLLIHGDWLLACCEVAVENGVEIQCEQEVVSIEKEKNLFKVYTKSGDCFESQSVVNAAGIYSDQVASLISELDYQIVPTKGSYYLLDKSQGDLVHHILFPCPTKEGKRCIGCANGTWQFNCGSQCPNHRYK